ncbi:lipopolysaccharide-binding protein-like [Pecten maximus]|uniref:lipopolysaccharide-binding protein-like n=1 Tax=Pecten maximus TaxID=6579 RepID=UPI001458A854|nr:lipopolysaccharide-binding protein-like [Pecten maximus]
MAAKAGTVAFGLAVLCCLGIVTSVNPGFQARITSAGLNYANQMAISQLSETVRGQDINIPPGKAGRVSYAIKEAKITGFSPPSPSSLKPIPGSGLQWSGANIGISMSAEFKYSYKMKFIKISDHGSFDVSVSRVSFSVQAIFGKDTNGRPSIRAGPCTSDIGSLTLHFKGRMGWLYNLLRGPIEGKLKGLLKNKLCDLIGQSINKDGEKSLSKLKVTVGIGKLFQLDYTLTDPPKFTSNFMETYHKGEIDWKSAPAPPPFEAPPLPPWDDTSRMMYVWVSDFMMNSLLYQAQHHNFLAYNLTAQDLPESQRGVLNTTCTSSLCIGNFIPALQTKYPNCQLELLMRSSKTPEIAVVNNSIETKMFGSIALYAQPVGTSSTLYFKSGDLDKNLRNERGSSSRTVNSRNYILTMNANMTMTGQISVDEQVMHFKVTNMTITVSMQNSAVPNVSDKALNFLIKYAVKKFIQPSIDGLGKAGIPLPLGKATLTNVKVVLMKHAFVIATDVIYHP